MDNPQVKIQDGKEAVFAFAGMENSPDQVLQKMQDAGMDTSEIVKVIKSEVSFYLQDKTGWEKEIKRELENWI